MNLLRYLRTLRHLRAEQWRGQIAVRIRRFRNSAARFRDHDPAPDRWSWRAAPSLQTSLRFAPVPSQDPKALVERRFTFIGQEVSFGERIDWEASQLPLLWQYNLHYFDWLWSLAPSQPEQAACAQEAISDWIASNPPSERSTAWAPYPTSLRLINWSSLFFSPAWRSHLQRDTTWAKRWMQSIWQQATWLEGRLEYHLLANHLLENAVALYTVGVLAEGRDAERWRSLGLTLLHRELKEQLLADGCHYERSPMYHQRICWLLHWLTQIAPDHPREWDEMYKKAQRAWASMLHPDGDIALFNDASIGIYSTDPEVERMAEQIHGAWSLPDAGYYGYRRGGHFLMVDAAPIGPDYQPGHAHADYFSLEWSIAGQRFLADTGVFEYTTGPKRSEDRSTYAHNTVCLQGKDSCEVWGGFRVGARVRPRITAWLPTSEGFELEAEHRGYAPHRHRRKVQAKVGELLVWDEVEGPSAIEMVGSWHLAPGWTCQRTENRVICELGGVQVLIEIEGPGVFEIETSRYSPRFGRAVERPVLRYRDHRARASWQTRFRVIEPK